MTVFPFQVGEVTALYNRILKIRTPPPEPGAAETGDLVTISTEARKQKILEEAKHNVLERIRRTE